jgi:hypothetical protein
VSFARGMGRVACLTQVLINMAQDPYTREVKDTYLIYSFISCIKHTARPISYAKKTAELWRRIVAWDPRVRIYSLVNERDMTLW